jgi:hypothetical protein
VSRERITHVAKAVDRVDRKLSLLLGAVGVQLLSFFFAVVWYVVQRGGLH